MHNHKNPRIYHAALDVAEDVYNATQLYPNSERYNLVDQLRRCAVSIPSNIAEGCGRSTDRDTAHFLSIALGSSYEAETQLVLAQRLGYGEQPALMTAILSLQRQIVSFRARLKDGK